MPRTNVVITGLGVVSSIGVGCDEFFEGLLEKRSGITSLANRTDDDGATPGASKDPPGLWIGGPIIEFNAKQFVRPRKALKVMCREIQTAFVASQLAVENAGLSEMLPADPDGQLKPKDVGTVYGGEMFYGPLTELADAVRECMDDDGTIEAPRFGNAAMKKVMPLWMLKYLPNMPACHVGISVNAHGPNNSLVLCDVSGFAALIEAASCLERGLAKVMLTGASGSRICTTRLTYRGDFPVPDVLEPMEVSSRPHHQQSTGVVGGEGAAALILETEEHATSRGAQPIARVVAYASRFFPSKAMNGSARCVDISSSEDRGSKAAIQMAIETTMADAGVTADQVALVVSHGMGDPAIDASEAAAIKATVPDAPVTATIASLGHTGAASGAIDLVTAAKAIQTNTVPPTLQSDSQPARVALKHKPQPLEGDYVLCLSHTSQGSATAILIARP